MSRRRAAVLSSVAALIAVTALLASGVGDTLELPLRDLALRSLPTRPAAATVVVAVDEQSLRAFGPWPWPRPLLADLVSQMGGARGVVLDVLLAEPRSGDDRLAEALRRVPAIAVAVLGDGGEWLEPAPLLRSAVRAAHGNFELDHDGIFRRLASTKQSRDRALPAVAVEAAAMITHAPLPVGVAIAPGFRTAPETIPRISASELLRRPLPARVASRLRGKLVFFGPTALALGDRVLTPTSSGHAPDPGVTVHAAATESVLRGEEIRAMPPLIAGILAAAMIGVLVGARRRRLELGALLVVGTIAAGALLLALANVAIPFITLLVAVATVETIFAIGELRRSHLAAARMESRLGIGGEREGEVGARIEKIATQLAEHRQREAEAKRLLAHELKTPLASMRSLTQLLGGFQLSDAERQRVAALLESEAGKLQSLVTGLLDLERLTIRDFDPSATTADLGRLVAARVDFLRASTDRAIESSAVPGAIVRCDPALVDRIVDNLVGNALKYTPADTRVRVRVVRSSAGVALEVEDDGPGIAEAERVRLFDRFFRGSTAAGTHGLGLGLSFVAEIARWHGGDAIVESSAAGGTLFRVLLPAAEPDRAAPRLHAGRAAVSEEAV